MNEKETVKTEPIDVVVPPLGEINEPKIVEAATPKKSAKQLKTEAYAAQFAVYENKTPEELANMPSFARTATLAVTNALDNLPTGKFLEQEIGQGPSLDIYAEFIKRASDEFKSVPVGKGVEFSLVNGLTVDSLDLLHFVPASRSDINDTTYFTSVSLPNDDKSIKQIQITQALWKYAPYFLSGKVDEFAASVRAQLVDTMNRQKYYDFFNLLKTITAKLIAVPTSSETTPTNHLVGNSNLTLIDAVNEQQTFMFPMLSDNKQFAYDPAAFTGYNNAKVENLVHITDIHTYNNLRKYGTTLLVDEKFGKFSGLDNLLVLPTSIYNPTTKQTEKIDIFKGADGKRIKGAILSIVKSDIKKLYNFDNVDGEFYPVNQTTLFLKNDRYTMNIMPWTQCALYQNEALESEFVLPVENKA